VQVAHRPNRTFCKAQNTFRTDQRDGRGAFDVAGNSMWQLDAQETAI
jgi:hypothetical protein